MLKGAAAGLKVGGHLFIYGPFALSGTLIPDSNKDFDASLKARSNGSWGIRDAAWVADLADEQGLELKAMTLMPANNFFVVFTKVGITCIYSAPRSQVLVGGLSPRVVCTINKYCWRNGAYCIAEMVHTVAQIYRKHHIFAPLACGGVVYHTCTTGEGGIRFDCR